MPCFPGFYLRWSDFFPGMAYNQGKRRRFYGRKLHRNSNQSAPPGTGADPEGAGRKAPCHRQGRKQMGTGSEFPRPAPAGAPGPGAEHHPRPAAGAGGSGSEADHGGSDGNLRRKAGGSPRRYGSSGLGRSGKCHPPGPGLRTGAAGFGLRVLPTHGIDSGAGPWRLVLSVPVRTA